jgi:hypothetical protein
MRKTILRLLTIASVFAASTAITSQAQAATATYTCPQVVDVIWGNNGALFIDCVDQPNRFSNVNNCAAISSTIDDRKAWETLATAALLSGKPLIIVYDGMPTPGSTLSCPANGPGTIGSVSLSR